MVLRHPESHVPEFAFHELRCAGQHLLHHHVAMVGRLVFGSDVIGIQRDNKKRAAEKHRVNDIH